MDYIKILLKLILPTIIIIFSFCEFETLCGLNDKYGNINTLKGFYFNYSLPKLNFTTIIISKVRELEMSVFTSLIDCCRQEALNANHLPPGWLGYIVVTDIEYVDIFTGEICRQLRLLIWNSFIGHVDHPVGWNGCIKRSKLGWIRLIVIFANCEYGFIKEHKNLVQHPRINILIIGVLNV